MVPSAPAPTVTPAPVAVPSTSGLGDDLASKVGSAVTNAIRPMQVQLDNIDRRVTRLETGRAPVAAAPKPSAPRSQPARRPAPVAKPKPRPVVAAAPVNRIEVLDAPAVASSPRVAAPVQTATAPASLSQQKTECKVGAILQGRAWVKKGDGSFETYGVGDTLPDGKVISGISPERGIQVGGQAWKCP